VTDALIWVVMNPPKVCCSEKRRKSTEKSVKNGKRKGIKPVPKIKITRVYRAKGPLRFRRQGVCEEGRYNWSISA